MANWEVVVYGAWPSDEDGIFVPNQIIAHWTIEDRTEKEALKEAQMDVSRLKRRVPDWTMKEIT